MYESIYRSVIGKLNYFKRGSQSNILYIVHQCTRFSTCPKKEHGEAIRWLGRYLLYTRDKVQYSLPIWKNIWMSMWTLTYHIVTVGSLTINLQSLGFVMCFVGYCMQAIGNCDIYSVLQ